MPNSATAPDASGPDASGPDASGRSRSGWLLAALAALTIVLGVGIPLAPVTAEQPVVTWPRDAAAPSSTVLPLVPYRPVQLEATVPCATLRALQERPAGGDALRTVRAAGGDQGLVVAVEAGQVTVSASGAMLLAQRLPEGACRYQVVATPGEVRVYRDGAMVARNAVLAPQVTQLATDAQGPAGAGLAVTVHPDDRYASSPTAGKTVLLVGHLLALLGTLLLAMRRWPGSGPGLRCPRPGLADAALLLVTLAWAVIGPVNYDDAWYSLMARNAGESGYLGNYIYMFNVTEHPFVVSQYVLMLWGELGGWGLLWLRLLPVAYGLATWVLLRVLLQTVLGRAARLRWVAWALLVAHLLWWLPYGITLRPEPLVVACSAGVLVLAELGRRRRSIGALALATAVVAVAVATSPPGIVAAAPLVGSLPWLLRWLAERGWAERIASGAVAAAAATVAVPIGFADATLGDVLDSTAVHRWYYVTHPWYEEFVHLQTVLVSSDTGSWGRRAPIVLTIAVLLIVAIGSGRRVQVGDPVRRLVLSSAITTAVTLALLLPTPTKWVNHFGAVAAAPTVLLAAALLRSPLPRRAGAAAAVAATLLVAGAAALSFAGPNLWRPYSDWGQPFGNHLLANGTSYQVSKLAPNIGPLYLSSPLLWVVVAAVIAIALALWRWRGHHTAMTTDRALLLVTSNGLVALLLLVFVLAPLRLRPGWSVAAGNLDALTGQPCGLAETVQVLQPDGPQLGGPMGAPTRTGAYALAGGEAPPLNPPGERRTVWHDAVDTGALAERGELATPWYPLPAGHAAQLVVPVAGGQLAGQRVAVEIAATTPPTAQHTVELALDPEPVVDTWQEVPVGIPDAIGGRPPTAVRIVAEDRVTGAQTWLAVAAPELASWQPVTSVTRDQPVFADQLSAPLWPCVDQVAITHGIVEPPRVRLLADDGIWRAILVNSTFQYWGGSFVGIERAASYTQLATRLHPPRSVPTLRWGRVQQVSYDHPVGRYELRVEQQRRMGWVRGPSLASEDYAGRDYIG